MIENTPCAILNNEKNGFTIVIGNQIAIREWYKTRNEAYKRIMETDWNLIFAFMMSLREQEIANEIAKQARKNICEKAKNQL